MRTSTQKVQWIRCKWHTTKEITRLCFLSRPVIMVNFLASTDDGKMVWRAMTPQFGFQGETLIGVHSGGIYKFWAQIRTHQSAAKSEASSSIAKSCTCHHELLVGREHLLSQNADVLPHEREPSQSYMTLACFLPWDWQSKVLLAASSQPISRQTKQPDRPSGSKEANPNAASKARGGFILSLLTTR